MPERSTVVTAAGPAAAASVSAEAETAMEALPAAGVEAAAYAALVRLDWVAAVLHLGLWNIRIGRSRAVEPLAWQKHDIRVRFVPIVHWTAAGHQLAVQV